MDLNYLYHRHQIELMRAEKATCAASREAHRSLADLYAVKIANHTAKSQQLPA
jgi:hypothetical protein